MAPMRFTGARTTASAGLYACKRRSHCCYRSMRARLGGNCRTTIPSAAIANARGNLKHRAISGRGVLKNEPPFGRGILKHARSGGGRPTGKEFPGPI